MPEDCKTPRECIEKFKLEKLNILASLKMDLIFYEQKLVSGDQEEDLRAKKEVLEKSMEKDNKGQIVNSEQNKEIARGINALNQSIDALVALKGRATEAEKIVVDIEMYLEVLDNLSSDNLLILTTIFDKYVK